MVNEYGLVLGSSPDEAFINVDDTFTDAVEEAQIVCAARSNSAGFALLYRRYYKRLFWYMYSKVPDRDDASDLVQLTFLRALQALPRFDARKGTFASWLFAIGRNAAREWRRNARPSEDLDLLPERQHPSVDEDIADELIHRETINRLMSFLEGLPEDKRELLALRFAGGLTIGEIARVIGKREDATRKQITRTLRMLGEQLHDTID